jgi:hypothetical protein
MRITHLLSATLIATTLAATSAVWAGSPEKDLKGNEIFDNPKKQIEFGKLKYLKKSDTMFIPFVEVKLQNWGTQGAVAQTKGFGSGATQTAQARATLASSVDPKIAQELATEIHKDLIMKMRAEGWKVLTLDDVKSNKHYAKLKWEKEDKNTISQGIKTEKKDGKFMGFSDAGGSGDGYIIAIPEGQEFMKYGITGPAWPFRKIVKDMKLNIFIPTYQIQTMYFNAEEKSRSSRASASVDSGALVSLGNVTSFYLNPKLAGGGMAFKEDAYGKNTGVAGGQVVSVKDTSSKAGNALGAAFRAIGGAGIQSSKSERVIESNDAEVKAEALKLAGAYNELIAKATALYKGKK